MTDDPRDDPVEAVPGEPVSLDGGVVEPVRGSGIGLVRDVTALPDGRRITFYSCGDSDG